MKTITDALAIARRRTLLQDSLSVCGALALTTACVCLGLLLLQRLFTIPIPDWAYWSVAGVALALTPVITWCRRPSVQSLATMMDKRLNLKDRVGSALFASSMTGNPFAQQVVRDAEQAIQQIKVGLGFPVRLGKAWGYVPPVVAVTALVAVFLPQMDLMGLTQAKARAQEQQARHQAAHEQLNQAMQAIEKVTFSQPSSDRKAPDALADEALHELAQITRQDLANPEMRRKAAAKLSKAHQSLAQKTQDRHQALDLVRNAMSRVDPKVAGPADALADALRRGDFDAAREAIQELAQTLESMPDVEKKALQQQLANVAQQLDQAAQQHAQQSQQAQQQAQQMMRNAGLSQQQIQQAQQQGTSQQQLQQALQQQGLSPSQAQQTAKQIHQQLQQAQSQQSSSQCSGGMSQSFQQMSQSAGQQSQQGAQNQQGSASQSQQPSFSQSAGGANQALSQMAQMQQQLQQMQSAQSQLQNAMQSLSNNGSGPTQPQQASSTSPPGGSQAGTKDGGHPIGQHRQARRYQAQAQSDGNQREGRVIASWLSDGDMIKGQATVEFDHAITEARQDAEQAVTEDRVPQRYHESIRQYFNQLPQSADQVRQAPAAPR